MGEAWVRKLHESGSREPRELRQQLREGTTTSETLEQIGREASERCRYELYGGESAAAVGAIEDLIEAIRRSLEAERRAPDRRVG